MDAKVAAVQSHKYPVTLRLEKSDDKYDYYKAVDYFGTLGMYKVKREAPAGG